MDDNAVRSFFVDGLSVGDDEKFRVFLQNMPPEKRSELGRLMKIRAHATGTVDSGENNEAKKYTEKIFKVIMEQMIKDNLRARQGPRS